MLDEEMIRRKMVKITEYLDELRQAERLSIEEYSKNIPIKRMAERDIQLLVECASDITSHILSEKRESPPRDYFESFMKPATIGVYPSDFAAALAPFAGLRNRLVHEYEDIKDPLVHQSISRCLRIFSDFLEHIQRFLQTHNP